MFTTTLKCVGNPLDQDKVTFHKPFTLLPWPKLNNDGRVMDPHFRALIRYYLLGFYMELDACKHKVIISAPDSADLIEALKLVAPVDKKRKRNATEESGSSNIFKRIKGDHVMNGFNPQPFSKVGSPHDLLRQLENSVGHDLLARLPRLERLSYEECKDPNFYPIVFTIGEEIIADKEGRFKKDILCCQKRQITTDKACEIVIYNAKRRVPERYRGPGRLYAYYLEKTKSDEELKAVMKYYFLIAADQNIYGMKTSRNPVNVTFAKVLKGVCSRLDEVASSRPAPHQVETTRGKRNVGKAKQPSPDELNAVVVSQASRVIQNLQPHTPYMKKIIGPSDYPQDGRGTTILDGVHEPIRRRRRPATSTTPRPSHSRSYSRSGPGSVSGSRNMREPDTPVKKKSKDILRTPRGNSRVTKTFSNRGVPRMTIETALSRSSDISAAALKSGEKHPVSFKQQEEAQEEATTVPNTNPRDKITQAASAAGDNTPRVAQVASGGDQKGEDEIEDEDHADMKGIDGMGLFHGQDYDVV